MAKRAGPPAELIIITGLSGSGKGSVLKALEDLGYYSVDNLPIDLGDPTSVRVAGELVGEHSKVFEEVRAVRRALDAVHRIEIAGGQLTHSRYHESVSTAMMPPSPRRGPRWVGLSPSGS